MAAGTRRSARLSSSQASQNSSPSTSQTPSAPAGKKRKAESGASPSAKRGKQNGEKQQTIEDVMDLDKEEDHKPETEIKQPESSEKPKPAPESNKTQESELSKETEKSQAQASKDDQAAKSEADEKVEKSQDQKPSDVQPDKKHDAESRQQTTDSHQHGTNGHAELSEEPQDAEQTSKPEDKADSSAVNGKTVEPHARDGEVPSSILEKGVMYFLYRGRVNIDSPESVTDIQRSFLLLRPLPHGAKLGDGSINTASNNCRLIAIPKKTLPISGKDRWTGFVEKAKVAFSELKDNFLKSSTYDTQTQGTQTTPSTAPAAEGIYAITTTGRETHLAYIITLPTEMGEIQRDLGILQKGSFILSTKNPKASGPSNADLGTDPGFSEEIQEFRNLRWMPTQPRHLDYEYCQFLMIGEGEQGLERATEPQEKDVKNDTAAPLEEMEKLEGEDEIRIKHLDQEDAVFKDLGMDSESYPGLQTTW